MLLWHMVTTFKSTQHLHLIISQGRHTNPLHPSPARAFFTPKRGLKDLHPSLSLLLLTITQLLLLPHCHLLGLLTPGSAILLFPDFGLSCWHWQGFYWAFWDKFGLGVLAQIKAKKVYPWECGSFECLKCVFLFLFRPIWPLKYISDNLKMWA